MTLSDSSRNFWILMLKMYEIHRLILPTSNKISDLAQQIDKINTFSNFEKVSKGTFDLTELKTLFTSVQKEIHSILNYISEIYPHLKNQRIADIVVNEAKGVLIDMQYPERTMFLNLRGITFILRSLSQRSNTLILSPTKKSIKIAFGIDIGNEWIKIKTAMENQVSNY